MKSFDELSLKEIVDEENQIQDIASQCWPESSISRG